MKSVQSALSFFESNSISAQLEAVYSQVPGGNCCGSARCCCESVNCFYSEYLNAAALLKKRGLFEEYSRRAAGYWLREFSVPMMCPFLSEDKLCTIYEARPLPCRIFGHLERDDFEANIEAVREQNAEYAALLHEEYGIIVPSSITAGQVGFCENFISDRVMSADDRDELVDQLFSLECRFLGEDLLEMDEINFSLTQWFAYDLLGRDKAVALRIKAAQEYTRYGKSETLDSEGL